MPLLIALGPWSSFAVAVCVARVTALGALAKCSLTTADACSFALSVRVVRCASHERSVKLTMRVKGVWETWRRSFCVAVAPVARCS